MALKLNGFEGWNIITRGIGRGGPWNLDFFGPKGHSLRSCHFRAQKSLDFQGPPPPMPLVMMMHPQNYYVPRHKTTGTLIVIIKRTKYRRQWLKIQFIKRFGINTFYVPWNRKLCSILLSFNQLKTYIGTSWQYVMTRVNSSQGELSGHFFRIYSTLYALVTK